jgi:hypothetical protein
MRRQLTALAIAVICLIALVLLPGCATDYQWYLEKPPSTRYEWIVVKYQNLLSLCKAPDTMRNLGACAHQYDDGLCVIWSHMTEDEAKRAMSGDGIDLWTHELRHCEGWRHQ